MDDLSSAWRRTDAPKDPSTDDGYWIHTLNAVFEELYNIHKIFVN